MARGFRLGEFSLSTQRFSTLEESLLQFEQAGFLALGHQQRQDLVSHTLYELIGREKTPCFLLPAVIEYMEKIHALRVLENYTLAQFELWLNQFSGLSFEENYSVRAKIVGKQIPRSAYQGIFPVGMGKVHPGSHFVTAHSSPDLDTTIASFWGWIDAFGARVAEGLHLWNVPGGVPTEQVEIDFLFFQIFSPYLLPVAVKTRSALSLSGMDLMTQKGLVREQSEASILGLDHQGIEKAIVLVDENGYYLGDWRSGDVEGVRQVISLFKHCLRSFSYQVQMELLRLFAKEDVVASDVQRLTDWVLAFTLGSSGPARECSPRQREMLHACLIKVLEVDLGLDASLQELAQGMQRRGITDFQPFLDHLIAMKKALPQLTKKRHELIATLQQVMESLDLATEKMRIFIEKLGVALKIKTEVFAEPPHSINYRADVDEIKSKMAGHSHVSVTASDREGNLVPLGVVHARDLTRSILGTVTLRDFCNKEETKIPSYLEVISVIDHHKSQLTTSSVAQVLISDAQSSNVLCAEIAFTINDCFSLGGRAPKEIAAQAEALQKGKSALERRLLCRCLQKLCIAEESPSFFIDPAREKIEYLHFLYGILDDTDLLTKVSARDLDCVVQLMNRLKSLFSGQEVEILSLSDLARDETFLKRASRRILQNRDLYSLYKQVYEAKEKAVEKGLLQGVVGEGPFFLDTKEQNGCARIGQAKLFPSNVPLFSKQVDLLQRRWQQSAQEYVLDHAEIGLHMQMISTIAGAEEVFTGSEEKHQHHDELWIWIPFTEGSIEHLKEFLSAFSSASALRKSPMIAECYGERAQDYAAIFKESFPALVSCTIHKEKAASHATLKFSAGLINSRKAMISPYLPKPVK